MSVGNEERRPEARIVRAREGRVLGGVCAGLPDIWGLGTNGRRLLFIVLNCYEDLISQHTDDPNLQAGAQGYLLMSALSEVAAAIEKMQMVSAQETLHDQLILHTSHTTIIPLLTFLRDDPHVTFNTSKEGMFHQLLTPRIDYAILSRHNGERVLKQMGLTDAIVPAPSPLVVNKVYMLMSRKSPCAARLAEFDAALDALAADGTINRLIAAAESS